MDSTVETWVELPHKSKRGYTYSASSLGKIRSNKSGIILRTENKVCGAGYESASLGSGTSFMVHQLVCTAFHGEKPTPRHQVNHIDGNKRNNSSKNLEWVLPSENIQHAIGRGSFTVHGLVMSDRSRGRGNPKAKLTEESVREIRKIWASKEKTQVELGLIFGVDQATISSVCRRDTWDHIL